jgi:tetratricopeptide (TPR) repeat protein
MQNEMKNFIKKLQSYDPNLAFTDIADILWLAQFVPSSLTFGTTNNQSEGKTLSSFDAFFDEEAPLPPASLVPPSHADGTSSKLEEGEQTKSAALGIGTDDANLASSSVPVLPFRAPGVSALTGGLKIARALRPLGRQVPSPSKQVFDEEATIYRIAEEGVWLPATKPSTEKWLDLALVIDKSRSMLIWERTVWELRQLLTSFGIFKNVECWELRTETSDGEPILTRQGDTTTRSRRARELYAANGRRQVVVLSDCVSQGWRTGKAFKWLAPLAKNNAVTLFQLLPERMWEGTALDHTNIATNESVYFHFKAGEIGNRRLVAADNIYFLPVEWQSPQKLALPVVELEPGKIYEWACTLAESGQHKTPGFVINFAPSGRKKADRFSYSTDGEADNTVERLLKDFVANTSQSARTLAVWLSAFEFFNLPLIRLIQRKVLPETNQSHLAEIYLSNLIVQLPSPDSQHVEQLHFRFVSGVREVLNAQLPEYAESQIWQSLTDFVIKDASPQQLVEFSSFLLVDRSEFTMERRLQRFAAVTAQKLVSLGGKYAEIGEQISSGQLSGNSILDSQTIIRRKSLKNESASNLRTLPSLDAIGSANLMQVLLDYPVLRDRKGYTRLCSNLPANIRQNISATVQEIDEEVIYNLLSQCVTQPFGLAELFKALASEDTTTPEFQKLAEGFAVNLSDADLQEVARPYIISQLERNAISDLIPMRYQVFESSDVSGLKKSTSSDLPSNSSAPLASENARKQESYLGEKNFDDASQQQSEQTETTIEDALLQHRHVVLLGQPGAGKTESLRKLISDVYSVQKDTPSSFTDKSLPPIVIYAQLNRWHSLSQTLEDFVVQTVKNERRGLLALLLPSLLKSKRKQGQLLLLLDGLDELPNLMMSNAYNLSNDDRVQQIFELKNTNIVTLVAARLNDSVAKLKGFQNWNRIEIMPFTKSEVQSFTMRNYDEQKLLTENQSEKEIFTSNTSYSSEASSPTKLQVFLCYSYGDTPAVRELYARLQAEGWIHPWLDDEELLGGQVWRDEIEKAVRRSHLVLVCLSKSSTNKGGFIRREIAIALDQADMMRLNTTYIVPIRLEDCPIPERLSRWQCLNYYEPHAHEKLLRAMRFRAEQLGSNFESTSSVPPAKVEQDQKSDATDKIKSTKVPRKSGSKRKKEHPDPNSASEAGLEAIILTLRNADVAAQTKNGQQALAYLQDLNVEELPLDLQAAYYNIAGEAYFHLRNHLETVSNLEKSLQIYRRVETATPLKVAQIHNMLGVSCYNQNMHEKALEHHTICEQAVTDGIVTDRRFKVLLFANMGNEYLALGRKERAIEAYIRVLAIVEPDEDDIVAASVYWGMGKASQDLGSYHKACEYYAQSLQLYYKLKMEDMVLAVRVLLGLSQIEVGDFPAAEENLLAARDIAEEAYNSRELGNANTNLAYLYFKQQNWQQAERYAQRGILYARNSQDKQHIGLALAQMGEIKMAQPHGEVEGKALFEEALQNLLQTDAKDYIRRVYRRFANSLKSVGRMDEAFDCLDKAYRYF